MIVVALASLAIPIAFLSPFLGLLCYCWLAYMRPQDMAWGVGHITFGLYTAVALFLGLAVRLRFAFFRWTPVTWALAGLWTWWAVATWYAVNREVATDGLVQISRIFLICLVTTGLCTTKHRLKWVVSAIAGSLLFHGTKLGLRGVLSGGARQLDPIGGLMSGNNENALALGMALPFAVHFAVTETRRWQRAALWAVAALTCVAIVCTYSRGGFLGLAAAAAVLAWHSRRRWATALVAVPALAVALLAFAPSAWVDRMTGIDDAYATDLSAQFRLQAWSVAADITAEHPVVGIGPKNFLSESHRFARPAGMADMEIHNTYLDLSTSLGLPGLLLYLALMGAAFTALAAVRRDVRERGDPRLSWFATLAAATQASLVLFLVASTFGSLAHFDLAYHVCALAACLPVALRHETGRLLEADAAAVLGTGSGSGSAPAPATAGRRIVDLAQLRTVVSLGAGDADAGADGVPGRYERRPEVGPIPSGLPDFRRAAAVPQARSGQPAAFVSGDAAGSPTTDARAPRRETSRRAHFERRTPPPRHTEPQGALGRCDVAGDLPADDGDAQPTPREREVLESLFIDPVGTECAGSGDEFLDDGTETAGPPRCAALAR